MLKKLSAVTASVVAIAFVFVSITYACSGMSPMNRAVQESPMDMGGGNPPCSKEKGDICKSVRHNILSIQPSVSKPEVTQQIVLDRQVPVESPIPVVSLYPFPLIESAFHPVFKLPLTLSYHVLRI